MKTKMKRNIEDASLDYWPCFSFIYPRFSLEKLNHTKGRKQA